MGDYKNQGNLQITGDHEDQKDSKKQGNYKYHRTRVTSRANGITSPMKTFTKLTFLGFSLMKLNLVPRVLSYPPYGAREGGERLRRAGRREPWERG